MWALTRKYPAYNFCQKIIFSVAAEFIGPNPLATSQTHFRGSQSIEHFLIRRFPGQAVNEIYRSRNPNVYRQKWDKSNLEENVFHDPTFSPVH